MEGRNDLPLLTYVVVGTSSGWRHLLQRRAEEGHLLLLLHVIPSKENTWVNLKSQKITQMQENY